MTLKYCGLDFATPDDVPDELILTLRKPISVKGKSDIYELSLREPTQGELIRANKPTEEGDSANLMLLSFVSGIPPFTLRNIGVRDFREAVAYLAFFVEGAPKTVGNP